MSPPKPRRRMPAVFWVLMGLIATIVVVLLVNNGPGPVLGLSEPEFARFGYLVALLLFVGSALLGRRLAAGEVFQGIVVWSTILLVLIGFYAYREELLGVGSRLLGVLAPGVPIAGRLAGEGEAGSIVIVRSGPGHFGVRATVEGVPLSLLVDTGASFVTLTPADAAKVGVDTGKLEFGLPIRTANGVIQAAPIVIDRMAVGTIERRNVRALVAPPGTLHESLLGMSFLNTLNGYAISGDRLVLTP